MLASQLTTINKLGIDLGSPERLQQYYQILAISFTAIFVAAFLAVIVLVSVRCLRGQT